MIHAGGASQNLHGIHLYNCVYINILKLKVFKKCNTFGLVLPMNLAYLSASLRTNFQLQLLTGLGRSKMLLNADKNVARDSVKRFIVKRTDVFQFYEARLRPGVTAIMTRKMLTGGALIEQDCTSMRTSDERSSKNGDDLSTGPVTKNESIFKDMVWMAHRS